MEVEETLVSMGDLAEEVVVEEAVDPTVATTAMDPPGVPMDGPVVAVEVEVVEPDTATGNDIRTDPMCREVSHVSAPAFLACWGVVR